MRFKYIVISIMCVLVMVASVILPMVISNMQNNKLLEKVTLDPVKSDIIVTKQKLSIVEKINLINSSGQQENQIAITTQKRLDGTMSAESEKHIENISEKEVKKLIKIGLAPDIDMDDIKFDYTIETYLDMSEPSLYAVIWKVDLASGGTNLSLEIDDETHKIFNIRCTQTVVQKVKIDDESVFKAWSEYLGLQKRRVSEVGDNKYVEFIDDAKNSATFRFESYASRILSYSVFSIKDQFTYTTK